MGARVCDALGQEVGVNYYERYCGDYAKKTAKLTLIQHGAYTLLLDEYYSTEEPLSGSLTELYRICRAMTKPEQEAVRIVADRFFPVSADGLRRNDRANEMIEKARPKMEAARANGKKGGRPKKNPSGYETETQEKPSGFPSGFSNQNPTETQSETTRARSPTPTPVNTLSGVVVGGQPTRELSDDFTPKDAGEWLRHFRTKHGFEADPTNVNDRKKLWPVFSGWVNAGLTASFVDAAVALAIARSPEPISCLPLYVDRFMANAQAARASPGRTERDESRRTAAEVLTNVTMSSASQRHESPNGTVIDVDAKRIG